MDYSAFLSSKRLQAPLHGIGSEGYVALQHIRKFVGIELKESYFQVAKKNLERVVQGRTQATLFDLTEEKEAMNV